MTFARPTDACGVMHDLAWGHEEPDEWRLNIDIGSSPVTALQELLEAVSGAGVESITLSRTDLDDV